MCYVRKTVEEGWSRNTLINCIKADLYHKEGTAVTNFSEQREMSEKDVVKAIMKYLKTVPGCFCWKEHATFVRCIEKIDEAQKDVAEKVARLINPT